jgi:hypothetical protein
MSSSSITNINLRRSCLGFSSSGSIHVDNILDIALLAVLE